MKKILFALLFINSVFLFASENFVQIIPNGKKNTCLNCHSSLSGGTSTLKEFGQAFRNNFHTWDSTLAKLDSDGDGFTNGEELQDSKGVWVEDEPPIGNINLVTNPNDKNDHPIASVNDESFSFQINKIFPIPAVNNLSIELNLKSEGFVQISIFTLDGKFYSNLNTEFLSSGETTMNINLENLKNLNLKEGIYFIEFKMNDAIIRKKIILK